MTTLAQNILTVGTTVRAMEACELVPVGMPVRRIATILQDLPLNTDARVALASGGQPKVSIGLFRDTSTAVDDLLHRVSTGRTDMAASDTIAALATVERPQPLFLDTNAPYPSLWNSSAGRMSAEGLVLLLSAGNTDPFAVLPKATWQAMADTTERFLGHLKSPMEYPSALAWVRRVGAFGCAKIAPSTAQKLHHQAAEIYLGHAMQARAKQHTSLAIDILLDASHEFEHADDLPWHRLTQIFLGKLYLERSQPQLTAASFPAVLDDAAAAITAFENGDYLAGWDTASAQHAALLIQQPMRPQDPAQIAAFDKRYATAIHTYKELGRFRDEAAARLAWFRGKPTLVSPEDEHTTLAALDRISTILDDSTIVADFHMNRGAWDDAEICLTLRPAALANHHALRAQNDTALTPDERLTHWRKAVAGIAATNALQARAWQKNIVELLFEAPGQTTELLTELEKLAAMDARLREMTDAKSRFWRWLAVEGRIYRTVEMLLTHDTDDAALDLLDALQTQFRLSTPAPHTAATTAFQAALASLDTALAETTQHATLLHREIADLHLHVASERALPGDVLHSIPEATAIDPEDPLTRWQMEGIFAAIAVGDYKGAIVLITEWGDDIDIDSLFDVAHQFFATGQYAIAAKALRAHLANQPSSEPGDNARTGA